MTDAQKQDLKVAIGYLTQAQSILDQIYKELPAEAESLVAAPDDRDAMYDASVALDDIISDLESL